MPLLVITPLLGGSGAQLGADPSPSPNPNPIPIPIPNPNPNPNPDQARSWGPRYDPQRSAYISPLYLPYISPISAVYLPCISRASPVYLPCISPQVRSLSALLLIIASGR